MEPPRRHEAVTPPRGLIAALVGLGWRDMKATLFAMFVALLMAECGGRMG